MKTYWQQRDIKQFKNMRKVIKSGELKLGSLTLKTHVLDDGTRIIEEQSMIDFLEWMEKGELMDTQEDKSQLEELAKFCQSSNNN